MHPYEVMAEPIRRRIVEVLACGEHTAGTLEQLIMIEFGVSRSAVQHHLSYFKRNGWVDVRPELAERWYRLEPDVVPRVVKEAHRLRRLWRSRYGSIERRDPPIPRSARKVESLPSRRGHRGHGDDPDDPWRDPSRMTLRMRLFPGSRFRTKRLVPLLAVLALTGCTAVPSTPSEFTVVQYPEARFAGLYAQTAAAAKSIDMEMYELSDPIEEAALIAAHHRGVTVRVLLDSAYAGRRNNQAAYDRLARAGVAVKWAEDSTIFHIKTTTFDEMTSDISTANLTSRYYPTTRDAEIVDSYPVQVAAIEQTFDRDWAGNDPSTDEAVAPGLIWSPDAEQAMVNQIDSATTSIQFTSEELSDPYISRALAADARRGVRCELTMMDDRQWQRAFAQVTAAGCLVHVLPETATGLYIHEKLVLVDSDTSHASVMIGSQNASYSSLSFNRELSIVLTGAQAPNVIASIAHTFASDFSAAQRWRGSQTWRG
jgi:DNA-binding transcriptional ArsR family regulator